MTNPREEIKRLADDLAAAHATHAHRVRDGLSEYDLAQSCKISNEARAALHAAIDAIPSIRQTMVTCVRCGLLVPESDLMGNLTDAALEGAPSGEFMLALNVRHPKCHEAAKAFWDYWEANGETHKHGYYESTWGAINRAIRLIGVIPHEWSKP